MTKQEVIDFAALQDRLAAKDARFSSRGETNFADRLLSAIPAQFGGHAGRPAAEQEAHDGR